MNDEGDCWWIRISGENPGFGIQASWVVECEYESTASWQRVDSELTASWQRVDSESNKSWTRVKRESSVCRIWVEHKFNELPLHPPPFFWWYFQSVKPRSNTNHTRMHCLWFFNFHNLPKKKKNKNTLETSPLLRRWFSFFTCVNFTSIAGYLCFIFIKSVTRTQYFFLKYFYSLSTSFWHFIIEQRQKDLRAKYLQCFM